MRIMIGLLVFASVSMADVMVIIQPSADLSDIVWTVSWDSLAGSETADGFNHLDSFGWDSMNPADGSLSTSLAWGDNRLQKEWDDVGNPFGSAYSGGVWQGFGDGVEGVVGSGGWGVGADHDAFPDADSDDLFIFSTVLTTGDAFPTSGSFVLTIPGAHLANYNIGVHDNNPYVTIIVTDTPHVPEPGTFALFGLAALGYGIYRRRKSA